MFSRHVIWGWVSCLCHLLALGFGRRGDLGCDLLSSSLWIRPFRLFVFLLASLPFPSSLFYWRRAWEGLPPPLLYVLGSFGAGPVTVLSVYYVRMLGDPTPLSPDRTLLTGSPKSGFSCKMVLQAVGRVLRYRFYFFKLWYVSCSWLISPFFIVPWRILCWRLTS